MPDMDISVYIWHYRFMDLKTPQQQIELFHLLFLKQLGERIDKQHFALKGGCNLRFYFKSIRYSEDIDLDVKVVAKDTLKNQVSKILTTPPFLQVLQTRKITITDVNPAKQTETTRQWKVRIQGPASRLSIPTKIEFSRRGMERGTRFEPIDAELISNYQLYPVLSNHYELSSAFQQKVEALIHRTETQARDIFDLIHLLNLGAKTTEVSSELKTQMTRAIENTLSISYEHYRSQVVAYLKEEYQEHYGTESKWNEMQEHLINVFESIQEGGNS